MKNPLKIKSIKNSEFVGCHRKKISKYENSIFQLINVSLSKFKTFRACKTLKNNKYEDLQQVVNVINQLKNANYSTQIKTKRLRRR